jgi:hypothetical protein
MNQRKRVVTVALYYVRLLRDSSEAAMESTVEAATAEAEEETTEEATTEEATTEVEAATYLFLSVMPSVFGLPGTTEFIMRL